MHYPLFFIPSKILTNTYKDSSSSDVSRLISLTLSSFSAVEAAQGYSGSGVGEVSKNW